MTQLVDDRRIGEAARPQLSEPVVERAAVIFAKAVAVLAVRPRLVGVEAGLQIGEQEIEIGPVTGIVLELDLGNRGPAGHRRAEGDLFRTGPGV